MNSDRSTSFNVGDREPDADGARTSSASPTFGEHHVQLRMVGAAFYINDLTVPGEQLSSTGRAINQPASKPAILPQRTCSLTHSVQGRGDRGTGRWHDLQNHLQRHSHRADRFGGTDGEKPLGALVLGTDGNFYGTTSFGGSDPGFGGTVFKITPSGTLTTLYSFGSGDGFGPSAALIRATDGNFYGTTGGNGTATPGTAFKITPSGTLTTLATFSSTNGETPVAPLVEGTAGLLYGTTEYGVNSACYGECGTVFSLSAGLH